ncbi:MAG: hypothetical protein ABEJ98_05030 [Candidatus Nanohaloarchaea archaeon]
MTHQKRLPAPKHYPIQRKSYSYVATVKGSRSSEDAIPAVVLLREVLGYADNEKEAKKIIKQGDLLRNGEELKDIQQGVGVLDNVEIHANDEKYRVVRKGKYLRFIPIEDDRTVTKIVGKEVDGDSFLYRLHNGENYRTKDEYSTGNTLVFNDGVEEIDLEEGAEVLVTEGQHSGETGTLEEVHEEERKSDLGLVKENGEEFQTGIENLVAIKDDIRVTK